MSFTKEHVVVAASQQQQILDRLAKTDYAKPKLDETNKLIDTLESALLNLSNHIKELEQITHHEKEDHVKYHEATWRRLAYHMSGHKEKYESKAKKEEREYFEAVQQEQKAKDKLTTLKKKMYEVGETKRDQEAVVKENQQAQKELDTLYDAIFGGKTPGFPDEDKQEEIVKRAGTAYNEVQHRLEPEQQAVKILTDAQHSIQEAIQHLDHALTRSHSDLLGDGSDMGQVMEKHSMSKAQSAAARTDMLVKEARKLSPKIEDIGSVKISTNNMMSVFDDPTTGMRKRIEQSDTELRYTSASLSGQISSAKRRVKALQEETAKAQEKLAEARAELQKLRTEAFKKMAPK